MPDFMRASDFIVTKAGPGTIAEALNAELPIILYSKLPGQEDGNVTFVERKALVYGRQNHRTLSARLPVGYRDPPNEKR